MRTLLTYLLLSTYMINTSCMEAPDALLRELGCAVIKIQEITADFKKINPTNQAATLRQLSELKQKCDALRNKLASPAPWDTEISGK